MINFLKKGNLYEVKSIVNMINVSTGKEKAVFPGEHIMYVSFENDSTEALELFVFTFLVSGELWEVSFSPTFEWKNEHSVKFTKNKSINMINNFLNSFLFLN